MSKLQFLPASHPAEAYSYEYWMKAAQVTKAEAKQIVQAFKSERVMLSSCGTYQVNLRRVETGFGVMMVHISCKRRDRQPLHDWRVKQEIKNAIVGPDCEAVELYPAERRLVDTANQYHLWAFDDPRMDFPFGYGERLVLGPGDGPSIPGAVQREFGIVTDEVAVEPPPLLERTVHIRGTGDAWTVDLGAESDPPTFHSLAGAQAFCVHLGLSFVLIDFF